MNLSQAQRLIDYILVVGPGRGAGFQPSSSSMTALGKSPASFSSWHCVSQPFPTILKQYPANGRADFEIAQDVAYFCQPEGSCAHLDGQKLHNFMLTDTETNTQTYGVCLSLPHLFDPLLRAQKLEETCSLDGNEGSMCIQEWGVLSVCVLTKHPFFNFFRSCLTTLAHMVEHFCGSALTWNAVIQSPQQQQQQQCNGAPEGPPSPVGEVEEWLGRLLALPAPLASESALEVELEVNPALFVAYPPPSRFPLLELPVHSLFQKLDVCMLIDIFKLVLSEQKVVVHSADASFASTCVLAVVALLYPLQYLFPVIPLLPSSMPSSENLFLVPTPFFIGVCSSFLDKLSDVHLAEPWIINLDSKEISAPEYADHPLDFPYCILQLQADVRRALDSLEETPPGKVRNPSTESFCSSVHEAKTHSRDDVDVMIRVAFVEFLFSPEILGQIDRHLCVFRLFPRPVVALKTSSFMAAYQKASPSTSPEFISRLIKSQGIEYFYEWSLNPTNFAFQEVRKGVLDVERLSDKCYNYLHKSGMRVEQVCLYSNQNESILYQEMLAYKAGEATFDLTSPREFLREEDDSDWEYVAGGDYYDGDSELSMSTPSYYSDTASSLPPPQPRPLLHGNSSSSSSDEGEPDYDHVKRQIIGDFQRNGLIDPDAVEVGFYTPKRFSFPDVNLEVVPDSDDSTFNSNCSPPHAVIRPPSSSNQSTPYPNPGDPSPDPPPPPDPTTAAAAAGKRHLLHVPSLGSEGLSHSCEALPVSSDTLEPGDSAPQDDTDYYSPVIMERSESYPFTRTRSPPYTTNIKSDSEKGEYFDDDAILFTRQSVSQRGAGGGAEPRKSWLHSTALSGAAPTTEVVEFSTPSSTLKRSSSLRSRRDSVPVSRNTPVSAVTHLQALEGQVQELVKRLVEGQGLPWPKPAGLKKLAAHERTRVMVLRQLEVGLGVRSPDELRMATSQQIAVVGVGKAVFRGLLDLLKFFLQCVEEDLQREPEGPIFSVFLILRIAFCIHLKARQDVSPSSFLALGALRVSSLSISSSSTQPRPRPTSPAGEEAFTAGKGGNQDDLSSEQNITPMHATKEGRSDGKPLRSETSSSPEHSQQGDDRSSLDSNRTMPLSEQTPSPPRSKDQLEPNRSREGSTSPAAISRKKSSTLPRRSSPSARSADSSPGLQRRSNLTQSLRASSKSPVLPRRELQHSHSDSFVPHILALSPRFLQHSEGRDLKGAVFLYKELVKQLGSAKTFMLKKDFWNVLFMSTVGTDRNALGWNEKTEELYERHASLSEEHRQAFGLEEDNLLSVLLHDLLVYMLMVGVGQAETTGLVHRFAARCRLATVEEKLLQQTLKHVELHTSREVDLSDLGLVALYSEVHPTISYIVHYGVCMMAPVYKLQITDEALILRRFPDERVSSRLWNDCITEFNLSDMRSTLSIRYRDSHGELSHHFHTKQFRRVFESVQEIISSS